MKREIFVRIEVAHIIMTYSFDTDKTFTEVNRKLKRIIPDIILPMLVTNGEKRSEQKVLNKACSLCSALLLEEEFISDEVRKQFKIRITEDESEWREWKKDDKEESEKSKETSKLEKMFDLLIELFPNPKFADRDTEDLVNRFEKDFKEKTGKGLTESQKDELRKVTERLKNKVKDNS